MSDNKSAMQQGQGLAEKAGEFLIGTDLRVTRLGFGAMETSRTCFGIHNENASSRTQA
jgi:hypothetical protein